MFVVFLVKQLKISERHIADCHIKEAVGKLGIFIALYGNGIFLIKLLCNSARYTVNFHTIHFTVAHTLRHKSHKIAYSARRLQDVTLRKAHIGKCLIHCLDYNRRSEVCGKC